MEGEKRIKTIRDMNILLWSLITCAFLGLLWKGFLNDLGIVVVLFVYYIGIITSVIRK